MAEQIALSVLAERIGARLRGGDPPFSGVSTDSRTLRPGDLFVALRGPNFDGHAFAAQAQARGAVALMVDRPLETALPTMEVEDTRIGLGRLAAAWRGRFALPLVAVTGSNGKTTVKEMLAAILGRQGPVLATRGNLNNDIGVPLTLLRLRPVHRAAVVEMGASRAGEIAWLTGLARPSVALITNAAAAHLEGFGSLEGVARAKGEIYGGLEEGGVAVVNADDPFCELWLGLNRERRVITFGLEREADVSARWEARADGSKLALTTPCGAVELWLPLPGRHNVLNALAATAAAVALGVEPEAIGSGLQEVAPAPGRLERKRGIRGACIIDDSYNANPASLGAALKVLAAVPGERLLVMGDMGELGNEARQLHRQIGRAARREGIQRLYATGELSRAAVREFGSGGRHFDSREQLIDALREELGPQLTLLVKGSRSAGMEQVVEALLGSGEGE
ncbi:MAG TPA: UDP-N-acetylmuramoyl-tripeptide--D-alanyl-D-alanine ligase [Gammaproteobacteria bacterium]|nr:UDP-N-acetylmuramoyl-tripeptide--D-alanyl-D-alanine ligase [Gammaproteobacteria bacterium]